MKHLSAQNHTTQSIGHHTRLNLRRMAGRIMVHMALVVSALFILSYSGGSFSTSAHAQQSNTCRTVYWGNGSLRFQECNDVTIKHIDAAQNGAVWIDTDADEVAGLGTSECVLGGGIRIPLDHPNSDELFAMIFNAFQRNRPVKLIRLKKTPGYQCDVDFVMSDL